MDYFKSRVTSEWSDSESRDSEGDTYDDDDDKDNHSHASDHEENCDKKPSERTPSKCAQELDL
ncbi:hypothetical protein OROGR_007551 [Orobanche gracilis]